MIAGACASAAGVPRWEKGRTYDHGRVQDAQTHGGATLQVGDGEMDIVGPCFHGGSGDCDTFPDGVGLADPQDNVQDTSVRRVGSHGGGADDPGPEGHAEYPCEGGGHGSGTGGGGICSRVNKGDYGGHGMETGRTDTTSPSDRGLGCGDIQRGNRSQGQGENTQRRATPRMGSETLLLAGGFNLSNNMGRGRETAGRTSARGGSRASEGRSSDQPRLGLARPGK
ncbi:unnamed protein product, partial [Ectocarpus fasciculatus]